MQKFISSIPVVLVFVVLLGAAWLLHSDVEYCGQPESLRPRNYITVADSRKAPTLAPPRKVVFVQIDTPADVEIYWE